MKNSESTNTVEETLDLAKTTIPQNPQKLSDKTILRKSFSEELPNLEIEDISASSPTPTAATQKIKSRSRLSSAFRSLRGVKSSRKKLLDNETSAAQVVTSGEEQDGAESFQKYPTDKEQKKKKVGKKFSLSGIRKYRVIPKKSTAAAPAAEEILISSSTQTSGTLERQAANLSASQISLIDLPDSGSDSEETSFTEAVTPVKFEKVRKIQITIQGKKIEQQPTNNNNTKRNLPTTTTSITGDEDYLTATPTPSTVVVATTTTTATQPLDPKSASQSSRTLVVDKPSIVTVVSSTGTGTGTGKRTSRKKHKIPKVSPNKNTKLSQQSVIEALELDPPDKSIVTESILDTPPRERAPTRPQSNSPSDSGKGAIRKTPLKLQRQELHEDRLDSGNFVKPRDKSSSLERGRRFPRGPRPTDDDDELIAPLNGNNLKNPNLSGSIAKSDEYLSDRERNSEELITEVRKSAIQFSVGSSVRPQQTSIISQATGEELSSLGSDKTSRSQSPVSESSVARRRIRYIDQATFYTDEEREILEGKREGISYLSGISEYSIDSEISGEENANMPAFGDLTMDHEEVPIMISSSGEKREHLYKILVIGELGTGKTSFIKRYVHQFFSQNYRATIGVDFALKVLHWDPNTIVRLQLWDIAGQERFGNMTRVYYKEAVGAFIVFDVTRSGTFECVSKWKVDLDSKVQLPDGSPIPCILLANKCDQEKQGTAASSEKIDEYVKENGFAGWYETSAKENINIDDAARSLVNKILLNDKLISAADIIDSEKFNLAGTSAEQGKKSNCPC